MKDSVIIAIPARFGSTRLPGKALRDIAGKTLIAHVIERALKFPATQVVVATDDARIARIALDYAVTAIMTRGDHATGSDRLAEVAAQLGWDDDTIVVNLQGDEPMMPIQCMHAVVDALREDPYAAAATLMTPMTDMAEVLDSACVKVVCDLQGRALYFSRASIPWCRDDWSNAAKRLPDTPIYRHLGLYAYRAGTLRRFAQWQQSPLEKLESLEQLRLLEHGLSIAVRVAPQIIPAGVDTEADLQRVTALLLQQSQN